MRVGRVTNPGLPALSIDAFRTDEEAPDPMSIMPSFIVLVMPRSSICTRSDSQPRVCYQPTFEPIGVKPLGPGRPIRLLGKLCSGATSYLILSQKLGEAVAIRLVQLQKLDQLLDLDQVVAHEQPSRMGLPGHKQTQTDSNNKTSNRSIYSEEA